MLKVLKQDEELNINEKGIVIIDFYADWCGPCKMISPILEELSSDVDIIKINVDNNKDIARKYGVMSIPTLYIYKDGKELTHNTGFITKEEIEALYK